MYESLNKAGESRQNEKSESSALKVALGLKRDCTTSDFERDNQRILGEKSQEQLRRSAGKASRITDEIFCGQRVGIYDGNKQIIPENAEAKEKTTVPPKQDWTILVELAASAKPGENNKDFNPKEEKLQELLALKKLTKGNAITVVAEEIVETEKSGQKAYSLERYEVRNGEVTQLEKDKALPPKIGNESQSCADVRDLLKLGLELSPSEHVAFIDNNHGHGNLGMYGDGDKSIFPTEQMMKAIKDGLKNSGRNKLDLLDFDACMMGEDGVLRMAKDVTSSLVCSAESERIPGQEIGKILKLAAQDPRMDGAEFGRKIIAAADRGANRSADHLGDNTHVLAHYNLDKLENFDSSLSRLSEDLLKAAKSDAGKQAIDTALNDSLSYGNHPKGNLWEDKRDIKSFVDKLEKAINSKDLCDESHEIMRDIKMFRSAEEELVDKFHSLNEDGIAYSEGRGLSVYAPDPNREKPASKQEIDLEKNNSLPSWIALINELAAKSDKSSAS